ncbi:MAG: proton-conducting transporter transmembrane domain-containing protein, partial [Phycisphaerales bacterium]
FFKALLFLSCGAVMHGFGGQLDLRKLSGVMWMPGWRIVGLGMLVGCLNLAGFPFTAGFFSKDSILAEAFLNHHLQAIGWLLLLTAGLTAYYTFRVFFRVFVGPKSFEPGDEAHGHDDHADHGHDHGHGHSPASHAAAPAAGAHAHQEFHPHPPGWAINTVLATLAIASLAIGALALPVVNHWVEGMVSAGTPGNALAHAAHAEHHGFLGTSFDTHTAMMFVSSAVGIVGILVAFVLHKQGRTTAARSKADELLPLMGPIPGWAQGKWFVDEFYNFIIRVPLWVASHLLHLIDKLIVDGLVNTFGWIPRALGWSIRPGQSGVLNGYAMGMAAGVAVVSLVALFLLH